MAIKEECERLGITLPELSVAYNFLIYAEKTKSKYLLKEFPAFPLRNGVGEHTSPEHSRETLWFTSCAKILSCSNHCVTEPQFPYL